MDDPDAFYERLRAVAARRPPQPDDPEADQARDDAIAAAVPSTCSHMQALLEIQDDSEWSALLEEEMSPGLGTFDVVIHSLARARAEVETLARAGDAFEEAVARSFAEAITSGERDDSEVSQVAEAMLNGDWVRPDDVAQVSRQIEEVTAVAIAAIREHELGSARRRELGLKLHLATVKLLLG